MKTLEEIKNEVAIEYSYESYDDFKNLTRKIDTDIIFVMDGFFNKVATILQQEQQKLIAENVDNNESKDWYDRTKTDLKSSIINENNIIK